MTWKHTHTVTFCPLDGSPCREWRVMVQDLPNDEKTAITENGEEPWWFDGERWRGDVTMEGAPFDDGDIWIDEAKENER